MASHRGTETFEMRSIGALLSPGTLVLAIVLGGIVGFFAIVIGDLSFAVTVGVGVAILVLGGVYYNNASTTVYATPDAIVTESGFIGSDRRYPFDNIDVVVRKSRYPDSVLGTGTYEIVRTGGPNGMVRFLSDPERFEQLVGERVLPPHQQFQNADRHRNHFWTLWPDGCEHALPETAVVSKSELDSALDVDLSDVDLDGLDEAVEMSSINDFDDIDAAIDGTGDAGAFDDSGSVGGGDADGGGFDGGDGGDV